MSSSGPMPQLAFREYEVRTGAPFAWVMQSVVQELAYAAASGRPEQAYGVLFGHWVAVNQEVVITGWHSAASVELEPQVDRGSSNPIGTWLRGPDDRTSQERPRDLAARLASASVVSSGLVLLMTHEGANSWAPRLWLDPAPRSPLARLRRPLRMRLRTFAPPGAEEVTPPPR